MTALYLVPTPIGNLDDITLRAIKILEQVDVILAEDTRTSGVLLKHLDIKTPMWSYHMFNEHKKAEDLVEKMLEGQTFALISDAGTPGISDPGYLLVKSCLQKQVKLECLPGATAFVPALVKSGLPTERFVFEGFLPHKKGRKTRIDLLKEEPRTIILYESPHRILKTIAQFIEAFGEERQVSISREISKKFEETVNGSLVEVKAHFEQNTIKGEFVIVLEGKGKGK